jgi:hypothetical protein
MSSGEATKLVRSQPRSDGEKMWPGMAMTLLSSMSRSTKPSVSSAPTSRQS